MLKTRKRIWFSWCGPLLALLLAFGPLSAIGVDVASAQSSGDQAAADLIETASDMAADAEPVDAPSTLELEQAESTSITLNFLNASDAPIGDFYLSFRAVAPRDGDDDPFDVGVYFRDEGNNNPYLNLVLVSDLDGTPIWIVFNEEGTIDRGELDPDVFPIEEGSRYNVEIAVIGDELAFSVNGEAIALVDISDNPDAGRISMASGLFTDTQIDGDIVKVSRISLYDLGGNATSGGDDDEDTPPDDDDQPVDDEDEDQPADNSGVAQSEIYGFSVTYDPDVWELRDITQTEQNYSSLGLDNVEILDFVDGKTQVLMFAGESESTARECVQLDLTYFEDTSTRYDFVGIAKDDADKSLRGKTKNGDGYYTVVYLDDNGPADAEFDEPEPITVYIECRPIVEGESMLLIEHYARDNQYNDAIAGRTELLAGIDMTGGGSASGNDDEEPVVDEEEEQPEEDGSLSVSIKGDVKGKATIEASGSSRARVTVTVDAENEGALVVIQEGTCSDLAGEAAFEIGEVDDQGEASARIRITPEELAGNYALTIIDPDTEDYEEPLGCGNIG